MIPVYQTRLGRGGNCLQAALASLLELPLDAVPDFMSEPDATTNWPLLLGSWLTQRGLEAIPVAPHGDLPATLAHMKEHYGDDEPYLLGGRTGGLDHGHVVVGRGDMVIHDPSDEPAALIGGIPHLSGRYLALLVRPMSAPVLPAPVDFSPLERHERIALAFSGGKDSLALWHLFAPYHPRLTVYHVDTGDRLPEAERIVQQYRARTLTPWADIKTDSRGWRVQNGLPSDLVPVGCTQTGLDLLNGEGGTRPLVSRFHCCAANRTMPLAERVLADGCTLLICGTRRTDGGFGTILNQSTPGAHHNSFMVGDEGARVERWLPIADWSGEDVFVYLRSVGAPIASYYEGRVNYSAPVECATCPASWNVRWLRWLREHHPDIAALVVADQRALRAEIVRPLARLRDSLAALSG